MQSKIFATQEFVSYFDSFRNPNECKPFSCITLNHNVDEISIYFEPGEEKKFVDSIVKAVYGDKPKNAAYTISSLKEIVEGQNADLDELNKLNNELLGQIAKLEEENRELKDTVECLKNQLN